MDIAAKGQMRDIGHLDTEDVMALALKALSLLAARDIRGHKPSEESNLQDLCDALVHGDDNRRHAVLSRLIAGGVSSAEIVDHFVPLAARKLGEGWVDDDLSFTEVSIGAARLQETVRAFGQRSSGVGVTIPLGHRILLIIPPDEQHTLGAFVAANQFRRYGLWVHLAIGQNAREIADTVRTGKFEMIGISGSGRHALDPVRRVVDTVKSSCPAAAPVIIGGNVCNLDLDLIDFTGADLVTTNPRKALTFCGLTVNSESASALECDGS